MGLAQWLINMCYILTSFVIVQNCNYRRDTHIRKGPKVLVLFSIRMHVDGGMSTSSFIEYKKKHAPGCYSLPLPCPGLAKT